MGTRLTGPYRWGHSDCRPGWQLQTTFVAK